MTPRPGSIRELLKIALPLIISSGSISLMHVVDRTYLTWYSKDALAAAMPGGLLGWCIASIPLGIAYYVNTFIAQYEGAERKDRVAASLWQGIYLALVAGCLLLVFIPLSPVIFGWIGHDAAVQQLEIEYFSVLCYGAGPLILANVFACFFSGRSQTIVVMWVNIVAALFNVVLDYFLIFGVGSFAGWGIKGAAIATVAAETMMAMLYVPFIFRRRFELEYQIWSNRAFDRELMQRLLRYGFPNGFQMFADIATFAVFILMVGRLGGTQLAATSLAFNLNTLAFCPMMGLGTAVMILVGRRIGENQVALAERTTYKAFAISAVYMLSFAAIYLFLPEVILAPYSRFADAAEFDAMSKQVVVLLRFVAAFSFFDGMVIVFGSAIRGAGDTRFPLVLTIVLAWAIMILPTFVALVWFDGDLLISWTACTSYIAVLGVCLLLRFVGGRWKSMRVIESADVVISPLNQELRGSVTSTDLPPEINTYEPARIER